MHAPTLHCQRLVYTHGGNPGGGTIVGGGPPPSGGTNGTGGGRAPGVGMVGNGCLGGVRPAHGVWSAAREALPLLNAPFCAALALSVRGLPSLSSAHLCFLHRRTRQWPAPWAIWQRASDLRDGIAVLMTTIKKYTKREQKYTTKITSCAKRQAGGARSTCRSFTPETVVLSVDMRVLDACDKRGVHNRFCVSHGACAVTMAGTACGHVGTEITTVESLWKRNRTADS